MFWILLVLFGLSSLLLVVSLIWPQADFLQGISKKYAAIFLGINSLIFFVLTVAAAPNTKTNAPGPAPSPSPVVEGASTIASPSPATSPEPLGGRILVKVTNVVDGDTIKIETGETVRYIGVDTPETVHPSKPIQCYGKEASIRNEKLVEGKTIELEKDVSETDKYGRLLRYVWLDGTLINESLVREGFAKSSTYPPDVKYQDKFIEAQRLAQAEQKGLWGIACTAPTPTPTPKVLTQPTPQDTYVAPPPAPVTTGGSWTCNCSKTCAEMSSCAEAQYQLNQCGCGRRDADNDGIACDSDCQ